MTRLTRPPRSTFKSRLEFETLLADLSSRFVNLPPAEVGHEIEEVQRRICETLGVDLSALWEGTASAEFPLTLTHFYSAQEGLLSPILGMSAGEYFPWIEQEMLAGRVVAFSSLAELPEEATTDRENMRMFGVQSNLTIPLSVGGTATVGALGFNTTRAERDWPAVLVTRLQLVAQVFANALARRRADEALRDSEARLSLAADSAGAGMWTLDFGAGVFWATERARTLFGYTSDEPITMERFEASVHPDDRERVLGAVGRAASAGEPVNVEYRIVSPGAGGARWISSLGRPVHDPDGHVNRLTGVSFDVTTRKLAERELRERLEFESLIAELSSRFVVLAPAEVDASIEEALGRVCAALEVDLAVLWQWSKGAPGEIVPTHWHPAQEGGGLGGLHQGQYPWVREQMLAGRRCVATSLDELPAEAAVDRESGRLQGIKSNLTVPLLVGGKPVGALALNTLHAERDWPEAVVQRLELVAQVFANALARARAEEALGDHKDRLEAGADLAGLGFYEVDFARGAMWFDDRLRELFGLPPDRRRAWNRCSSGWRASTPTTRRPFSTGARTCTRAGWSDSTSSTATCTRPWARRGSPTSRGSPSGTPTGRTARSFGVLRDVTAVKRTEETLHDLSRRLIRAHEEERALLARELHDDVTQRLAVLAIDVGRAELAAPDAEHAGAMRSVREALVRLSEDIHALAYQLHPSVLDELGLAAALRAECERRGRQGTLALQVAVEPLPVEVDKDAALCLFRVAQEALNNATRHGGARSASVTLRQMDDGLLLAVRDDGVGFDPSKPAKRRSLGLASMRERVQLVNGTLDVESAPGRGTAVVAWVPLGGASQ